MSHDNERRARELLDRLVPFPDPPGDVQRIRRRQAKVIAEALDEAEAREREQCAKILRALMATGHVAPGYGARMFRMGRNEALEAALDVLTNPEPPTPTTEEG